VLDIETVQPAITKLYVDSRYKDYTNKQHGVLTTIKLRHVINTRTFYENLCECVCNISLIEQYNRVILVISFSVLN